MLTFLIGEEDLRQRADVILTRELPELSRSYIKRLAHDGKLHFEDKIIPAGYKLRSPGKLQLDYDMTELQKVPTIELPTIYEDEQIIIINKPSGVITHARGKYWNEASVASSIRRKLSMQSPSTELRSGIVHRLDRATSGVIVCAKTSSAAAHLQAQFADRSVQKEYIAWIAPSDLPEHGLIDKPIARNPKHPSKFRADPKGKAATTEFWVTSRQDDHDQLQLAPQTGRTHQLRVHLASIGWPIIGDAFYDGQPNQRLLLHAAKLTFRHPATNKVMCAEAPLPIDFEVKS